MPSAIVDSNLVRAAVAERLRQRTVHQAHLQPGATHDLRRRCVFGDLAAKRLDPAGALKLGAPPQHCFALSKTAPETVDHVLPTRLISVEEAHSTSAQNPRGWEPIGGEATSPVSARQLANSR